MLNDSYWEEYYDGERAYLFSADKEIIAFIQEINSAWNCVIYPELIAEKFYWIGIYPIEEIEWQTTLYIYNRCNEIANSMHRIRDHLPSIHELADRVGISKG